MKINKNSEKIDTSIFDETLKEIDQILNNLDQNSKAKYGQFEKLSVLPEIKSVISKIHIAKKELVKEENNLIKDNNLIKRIKKLEENINNSNELFSESSELKKEDTGADYEHEINTNHLSIDELHNFEDVNEEKKKKFGFYNYLILIFVIFFALYGTLNISKNFIISKYPITETYIQHFFEITEILKISILGTYEFIKNII